MEVWQTQSHDRAWEDEQRHRSDVGYGHIQLIINCIVKTLKRKYGVIKTETWK
jgi:hypothetical protein